MQSCNLSYLRQGDLYRVRPACRPGPFRCGSESAVRLRSRRQSGRWWSFPAGEDLRSVTEARTAGMVPAQSEAGQPALDLDRQVNEPVAARTGPLDQSSSARPWSALASLPLRRWVAMGLLAVPLIAMYTQVDGRSGSVWSLSAGVASGVMAALILASYVPRPGSGRLLGVGGSPCSVAAAGAVIGSMVFWSSQPHDAGMIVLAVALLVFGLRQRLTDVQACRVQTLAGTETGPGPR